MRTRIMGIGLPERKGATAATIIPVGCPMGCNFCTTSASFGDKGKFVNFFKRGDELFEVMNRMEAELEVHSFFVMDENFPLHRERAMRLRERMKEERKSCALSVFASANAMRKYTMRSWWNWACRGGAWVWNLRGPLQQAARRGNAGTHPRTAGTRNSRAGVNHHRAGASHTRQHYGGNRARGFARDRLPPVHALYAGTGNSAVSADGRRGTPTAQCGLC
jgi:hypothetical protein